MTEQTWKSFSGFFTNEQVQQVDDVDSEEEGGEGEELQWMGYKDVTASQGKSFIKFNRPKAVTGSLVDLTSGQQVNVFGSFHVTDPWWEITLLRTKTARGYRKNVYPSDKFALSYKLRDDPQTLKQNHPHLYLSKIRTQLTEPDGFDRGREMFYKYLTEEKQYDSLTLYNLEEQIMALCDSIPENEQTEDMKQFKEFSLSSHESYRLRMGQTHPDLMRYLPQLFPHQFLSLLQLGTPELYKLSATIDLNPGFLAFKPIVKKRCSLLGCETTIEALQLSGLIAKVPLVQREAMKMYEFIKEDTSRNGHTCSSYDYMMDKLCSTITQWEEALDFLEKNKITKTFVEVGKRYVYLLSLWKSENIIAAEIDGLVEENKEDPWTLCVDWECPVFDSIKVDADQWRAAQMIASQPVVAISGKGGCGKTHVVSTVITAARNHSKLSTEQTAEHSREAVDIDEFGDIDLNVSTKGKDPPIELLLTAPTGKAANLLGKRAMLPAYTLHQIIFSFRNLEYNKEWKHSNVTVLVVDECSLVSVSTFSFLIELLRVNAKLKRVVLLGDIRQLPSIEPGNFLEDVFESLSRIHCAIELRTNHRAESQVIVDNATRISKKLYPVFHPQQFQLCPVPNQDGHGQQDSIEVIRCLLSHEALQNHSTSQIISFTRSNCEAFNDICCKKYNNHRIKDNTKLLFRIGDKICCCKNGFVKLYETNHEGFMAPIKLKKKNEVQSEIENGGQCLETSGGTQPSTPQKNPSQPRPGTSKDKTSKQQSKSPNNKSDDDYLKKRFCNGEIYFIVDEKAVLDEINVLTTYLFLCETDINMDKRLQNRNKGPWSREKQVTAQCEVEDTHNDGTALHKGGNTQNDGSNGDEEEEKVNTPDIFCVNKKEFRCICKIRHAWARTIHTFQGSETDSVVYAVGGANRHQNWQHVYTAITRGKKNVFIVGQERLLREVIKTSDRKRKTSLRRQLTEKLQIGKSQSNQKQQNRTVANTTVNGFPKQIQTQLPTSQSADVCVRNTRGQTADNSTLTLSQFWPRRKNGDRPVSSSNGSFESKSVYSTPARIKLLGQLTACSSAKGDNTAHFSSDNSNFLNNKGLSPLFPRVSVSPFVSSHQSSTPLYTSTKSKQYQDTVSMYETEDPVANLSDIVEPKSNESQWSEVNDEVYDSIFEISSPLQNGDNSFFTEREAVLHTAAPARALQTGKSSVTGETGCSEKGNIIGGVTHGNTVMGSNDSQWSEVEDEQHYFGLDIEDIETMNAKKESKNTNEQSYSSGDVDLFATTPCASESPRNVTDRSSLCTSPAKRLATEDTPTQIRHHSPRKQLKWQADTVSVSPLKNDLAKLGL